LNLKDQAMDKLKYIILTSWLLLAPISGYADFVSNPLRYPPIPASEFLNSDIDTTRITGQEIADNFTNVSAGGGQGFLTIRWWGGRDTGDPQMPNINPGQTFTLRIHRDSAGPGLTPLVNLSGLSPIASFNVSTSGIADRNRFSASSRYYGNGITYWEYDFRVDLSNYASLTLDPTRMYWLSVVETDNSTDAIDPTQRWHWMQGGGPDNLAHDLARDANGWRFSSSNPFTISNNGNRAFSQGNRMIFRLVSCMV